MLGVVFGVGSVVAMLSVGEGASAEALEQIRKLGSNNIIISSPFVTIYGPNGEILSGPREAAALTRLGLGLNSYQNLAPFPLLPQFNIWPPLYPPVGPFSSSALYQLTPPLPPFFSRGFPPPGFIPFGFFPGLF